MALYHVKKPGKSQHLDNLDSFYGVHNIQVPLSNFSYGIFDYLLLSYLIFLKLFLRHVLNIIIKDLLYIKGLYVYWYCYIRSLNQLHTWFLEIIFM